MEKSVIMTIKNFKRYKGRKDVTHNTWFRLSNRLLEDPDFYDFTAGELLSWVYMLSLASQKNSAVIEVNFAHAERVCRIKTKDLISAIKKLEGKQLLPGDVTPTLRGRDADVTDAGATRQDITEQDNTITIVPQNHGLIDLDYFDAIKPINSNLVVAWLKKYTKDFLEGEIGKAKIWHLAKDGKEIKSPGQFLSNWFSRNWKAPAQDPFEFMNQEETAS